jgi:hypothetical protein
MQNWIAAKCITVNSQPIDGMQYKLQHNDAINIDVPPPETHVRFSIWLESRFFPAIDFASASFQSVVCRPA